MLGRCNQLRATKALEMRGFSQLAAKLRVLSLQVLDQLAWVPRPAGEWSAVINGGHGHSRLGMRIGDRTAVVRNRPRQATEGTVGNRMSRNARLSDGEDVDVLLGAWEALSQAGAGAARSWTAPALSHEDYLM